ncbi:MAG TPA: hypothetical protein VKY73_10490 [Polyangiaceae bacterium]|nr:hypothetical protein [Polyangiaceae bacterium]
MPFLHRAGRTLHRHVLAGSALPAILAIATMGLAFVTLRRILELTGGLPSVPLDDAYIHFQFARSFAEGTPLVYSPGSPPVAGATSLLWPALLAVPYALGARAHDLVWFAWLFGWVSLALLADEVRRVARPLAGPAGSVGAAALVLCFGPNTWFAASGMEVVLLAWLLVRAARRAAEWCEGQNPSRRAASELVALAILLPLVRPEGALGSVLVAGALALTPRGRFRWLALPALGGVVAPALVYLALTGQGASTTARAKWLLYNPYCSLSDVALALSNYATLLVRTLLNGYEWSHIFLPRGSRLVALLALAALPVSGVVRGLPARGFLLFVLALGMLAPGTYDCPLCNRLRYLWPFAPAWLVGVAALGGLVGSALARLDTRLRAAGPVLVAGVAVLLATKLPESIEDVATSSRAITEQQVALGLWANRELPKGARLGVNDAGALTYFSGRPTFDIVGLTTHGEARYWAAGPGSRFEHYERLGRERLPTHFIVYPRWFAIPPLLGPALAERTIGYSTIVGGFRKVAHVADYGALGSAEMPEAPEGRVLVDRLDVADLESEAEHRYALTSDATQQNNRVFWTGARVDGGRSERRVDAFELRLVPRGRLVLRVQADEPTSVRVRIPLGTAGGDRDGFEEVVRIDPGAWQEIALDLPHAVTAGRTAVHVEALGPPFSSLHYFSLGERP